LGSLLPPRASTIHPTPEPERAATFGAEAGWMGTEFFNRLNRRDDMNTHKSLGFLAAVAVTVFQVVIFATSTAAVVA
jgi:hypothetical protein